MKLFENLRPLLIHGIPEVGVPPLDPLLMKEVDVMLGKQSHMICYNMKVTGIGNFILNYIQTDIKRLEVNVSLTFPFLRYEGDYDVDGRFMNFNLKGKGPVKGNATEVTSNALLRGKLIQKDGERYVEFTSAIVHVTLKDYGIDIKQLFADEKLNEAVNLIMNDKQSRYRKLSMQTSKPIIDKVASRMLLEVVNRISKNFSFDEVFV